MSSSVTEKLIEDYTEMFVKDLVLAARLYFESEGDSLLLMQSLFHAQQAAEKALKLFSMLINVVEPKELKRLGHHPLLETLYLLLERMTKSMSDMKSEGKLENVKAEKVIDDIEDLKKKLENMKGEIRKSSCYERIQKALELRPSVSDSPARSLEKIRVSLGTLVENREVAVFMYNMWQVLFDAILQQVSSAIEETPKLRDRVRRGEPLTFDQLKGIIDEVRSPLQWEFIRKRAESVLENPPAWLDQVLESSPVDRQLVMKILRDIFEDPAKLLQLFNLKETEQFPGEIGKVGSLLLGLAALGAYPLPNGRPLLDHVIFLDVFSECGRYVEAGDGETTPELLARKKDAARLLILAAELWTMFLLCICAILKTLRKEAERRSA